MPFDEKVRGSMKGNKTDYRGNFEDV